MRIYKIHLSDSSFKVATKTTYNFLILKDSVFYNALSTCPAANVVES